MFSIFMRKKGECLDELQFFISCVINIYIIYEMDLEIWKISVILVDFYVIALFLAFSLNYS